MTNSLKTPYLHQLVVSQDGREHLFVRAVLSLNRSHYLIYMPVMALSEDDDELSAEWGDEAEAYDDVAPTGFGRLLYDYENFIAIIEPINIADEPEVIDSLMATLSRLVN